MAVEQDSEAGGAAEGMEKQARRSKRERRDIVEETLPAGASVSVIARGHGVTANQVYRWRKLYRAGLLDEEATGRELLPVRLSEASDNRLVSGCRMQQAGKGVIEVEVGKARVRIEGAANPDAIRATLESLRE